MNRLGVGGVLWLAAAGLAIATTVTFRVDPVQWVVTVAVGVVAGVLGLWLIARPGALIVSVSNAIAVVWVILYAVLTLQQADEVAAWVTDVFLMGMGAIAGLAAYRAAAKFKLGRTIS
jgi:hypothetical protein